MRRIPIYRFINDAGLYMSSKNGGLSIGRIEWTLYLKKFFERCHSDKTERHGYAVICPTQRGIDELSTAISNEIETLKRSFKKITGNEYNGIDESLPLYDIKCAEKETETFSIAESLYRIIEFYLRFLSLMKAITKDEEMECMLPLSA